MSPSRRAATACALLCALAPAVAAGQPPPNVVLVLADDLGFGDLEPYGQERIRTPALAALAARGAVFSRAYAAAPVCAPSRCAILTGLHSGHCSVRRNLQPNLGLGLSDPTIADALGAAGYRTAFVGKWGLGGESRDGAPFAAFSAPWSVGFDHTVALLDDEAAVTPFPSGLWRDGTFVPTPATPPAMWVDDLVRDGALEVLEDLAGAGEPFFLVVASTLPHREIFAPDVSAYASEDWPEIERTYAAMVSRLDEDVGRLVAALEARELLASTLIVIASDNGPHESDGHLVSFFGSPAGLRGRKRDLYEGGVRVPLLVAGPGVAAGTRIEAPVSLADLLPTLADATGAPAPDGLDGESFLPLLTATSDEVDAGPRRLFLGAAEAAGGSEPPTRYALVEGSTVLVEREDGVTELYDLAADPAQAHDLSAARTADVERLRSLRMAEDGGSLVRADPVLAVEGLDLTPPPARTAAVVLDLSLDGDPPFASSTAPALSALAVGGTPGPDGLSLDRGAAEHLVVAAHPALSFGGESFSVEARLALGALSSDATAAERRWLAVVKPTGTPDGAIDWGVLAQAADLGAGSPHALALIFGRGRLRDDDVWTVTSHLAIGDTLEHDVAVRFDASAGTVVFELDGDREELVLREDLGHVRSDGPLVLGAHHDAAGAFSGGLGGRLVSFRLLRGTGPAATPPEPRELVIDLGLVELGADAVTRTLRVTSAATPPSRAMTIALTAERTDDRATARLDRELVLGSTDPGAPLTLTVTPVTAGPLEGTWLLSGAALRLGHDAIGSPIRIRVRAEVAARPAPPGTGSWIGAIEGAAIVAVLVTFVVLGRRRSPARR